MIATRPTSALLRDVEQPITLICEVVDTLLGLQMLAPEWREVFSQCPGSSMCAHPDWTIAWWSTYGHKRMGAGRETQPYVLTFRTNDGMLIGVVPLYEDQPKSPLKLRRLRSIGYLGRERAYDMTEEPTILVRSGYEVMVRNELESVLAANLEQGRWDFIAIIASDRFRLDSAALAQRAIVRTGKRSGSDYVDLPDSWSAYRSEMSKSMRENLPYYPRLLTRDGHAWQLRTIDCPDKIPAAIERLAKLHRARAASTRGRPHSNHLHTEIQIEFLADFLAATGGFVTELLVEDRVVASQAFYGDGHTLTVSYSGFDEAFYKYSPIFIIDASVFRSALESGTQRLNLLRNLAPWKTRWLAKTGEPISRSYLVNRRLVSGTRYLLHTAIIGVERDVILRIPVLWDKVKRTKGLRFRERLGFRI